MGKLNTDQYEHYTVQSTSAPTGSDDQTLGYELGNEWLHTTTQNVYKLVALAAPGAAVWKSTTVAGASHPVTITTVDPTVTDDSNAGYAVGDHWVNTSPTPIPKVYTAVSVAVGAAVWDRVDNIKYNTTSVVDPLVTNDDTQGYEIGSVWINTVAEEAYVCISAATGAAIWQPLQNTSAAAGVGKDSPREIFYGNSLIDYGGSAGATAGSIQYTRVWLVVNTVIEGSSFFVDSGGAVARNVRMGLYTQTDPRDFTLPPLSKIRETASVTTSGTNGTFVRPLWTGGDYTVPATGYYWIAVIQDSAALKYATTPDVFRADFLPVRRETGAGTTLPATASGLSNPVSALIWAAVVEKE